MKTYTHLVDPEGGVIAATDGRQVAVTVPPDEPAPCSPKDITDLRAVVKLAKAQSHTTRAFQLVAAAEAVVERLARDWTE